MSKGKKASKIFSRVMDGILGAVLALLLIFTTITIVQKYTSSSIVGYRMLWVQTPSMEEAIPSESYILVKDATADDVEVGDIIVFVSEDPTVPQGSTVTHRIIAINEDGTFKSKGDNNPIEDKVSVKRENVRYEYVRNLPVLSLFGKLYASPAGYGVSLGVVIIVFGIIIAMERKNANELNDKDVNRLVEEEVKRLEEEAKNNKIL